MQIRFEQLSFRYKSAQPSERPALKNIDVEFDTRRIIGICGMAGSGKSTFIRHLNGIFKPTSGQVSIDGQNIQQSKSVLHHIRQRIGMSFQFPERQLFSKNVWEELSYSLERRGIAGEEAEQRIITVCKHLDFDIQTLRRRSPFTLSRGEQRKLGIAIALTLQPELLVLDEPSAGMDRANAYKLLELLKNLHRQQHAQLILVSHDLELLLKYAEHLIILREGELAFSASPHQLLNHPEPLEQIGIPLPPLYQTLQSLHQQEPALSCHTNSVHEAVQEIQCLFPLIH
ncbi:MAG: ATP-binding cassette domain-containing protein [bacterium]|nr:ATP-binding cassette domain-containing protein [bacterium]